MLPEDRATLVGTIRMPEVSRAGIAIEKRLIIRHVIHAEGNQIFLSRLVIDAAVILSRGGLVGIRGLHEGDIWYAVQAAANTKRGGGLTKSRIVRTYRGFNWRSDV